MNELEIANRLADLYVSYRQRYIEARNNNGNPAVYVPHRHGKNKPLNDAMLLAHAFHRVAVGVFADSKTSKFITFDIDLHDAELVRRVMHGLEDVGFQHDDIHISTSGGKGYHVEIFFNDLMYTDDLLKLYGTVIEAQQLDARKVEFRPTHGQAIKLPLSKHHKTGNICWFLDRDTLEPIKSADYLLTIHPVDRDWATALIREHCGTAVQSKGRQRETKEPQEPAAQQPDGIPYLPDGTDFPDLKETGMRNKTMTAIAIRLRNKNVPEETIRHELARWVKRQNPDYITDGWDVIERDIDYLPRWVWSPKFKPGKTKELRLTAAEMRTIVRAAKGYSRKILLVLTVLCKRNGKIRISADRCSKYVGCAWLTANNALKKLTAAELITAQRGKVTYFNDHPVAEAKTYEVHLPASEQGCASIPIPYPFTP